MSASVAIDYEQALRAEWNKHSDRIFLRNGKSEGHANGGHDIVNNPALKETLANIAELYIPVCARKTQLLNDRSHISVYDVSELTEIDSKIKETDKALIRANAAALTMINTPGSGFEAEFQRHMDPDKDIDGLKNKRIRSELAVELVSSVIRTISLSCKPSLPGNQESTLVPYNWGGANR